MWEMVYHNHKEPGLDDKLSWLRIVTIPFTQCECLGKVAKWLQNVQSHKFAEGHPAYSKKTFTIDTNTN